jgi:hypothetical protein
MEQHPPDALMSYTRFDDQHHQAYLTTFREHLSGEVQAHTGKPFHIFQDIEDIEWGQQFEQRIDEALATVTFFIPILTPSFFTSKFCRYELERFLEREEHIGRGDLVLPVYYIPVPALEDPTMREQDPLAQTIAARQYIDWRDLRFQPLDDLAARKMLAEMARQVERALARLTKSEPPQTAETARQATADTLRGAAQRIGDVVHGDKVGGDKVMGDKIGGDKIDARNAQGFVNRPTGPVSQNFSNISTGDVSGSGIAIGHGANAQSQHEKEHVPESPKEALPASVVLKMKAALKPARRTLEWYAQSSSSAQQDTCAQILVLLDDIVVHVQQLPGTASQEAESLATDANAIIHAALEDTPDLENIAIQTELLEALADNLSTHSPAVAALIATLLRHIVKLID